MRNLVVRDATLTVTAVVLLGTLAAFAAKRQNVSPVPKSLPGSRAEIYKRIGDVELPVHIFAPANHRPGDRSPAIVFFFGGGWQSGSPAQFQHHCEYLASRGMVAMTAEYRVLSRHGVKAVECFRDAKSALRWVRGNAERLGIDPARVAAGGGSAGGHLAAPWGPSGDSTKRTRTPRSLRYPMRWSFSIRLWCWQPLRGTKERPGTSLVRLRNGWASSRRDSPPSSRTRGPAADHHLPRPGGHYRALFHLRALHREDEGEGKPV